MENLSHSRHPNRGSTSVSKKICNGNNGGGPFVGQTIYDDVYGGPPKFGVSSLSPRFEDYGEIFGSFHSLRASSIPILDLPAVDENEVFFDARSSGFDYAEVFGGFDGQDFGVSYEELIDPPQGIDGGSSDEAWTPAGTESLSDCSDHSGKSHCLSNGDSNQSSGGSAEFCVSYNKVNRETNGDMSNGKTHVPQLQARPGFTYMGDETNPLNKGTDDDPSLPAIDVSFLNVDFNTGKVKGNNPRNVVPHPLGCSDSGQSFEKNLISQNGYGRDVSRSHEDFITVSDISLRTEPSHVPPPTRPPPTFAVRKGDCGKTTSNCREASSEGILDDLSLPLFDIEVDANSSAAASAAAMKEAMVKAQAQMQSARDLWERKKEGVHGRVKLGSKNDMNETEEDMNKIPDRFKSSTNQKFQGLDDFHDCGVRVSTRGECQTVVKAPEVCSTPCGEEGLPRAARKTVEDRHENRFLESEKHDHCREWREAGEFFELERADISRKCYGDVNSGKISYSVHAQVEVETIVEAKEHKENSGKKVKAFQKADVLQENVKNIGNEVHGKEGDDRKLIPNEHETRQKEEMKLEIPQGICGHEANDERSKVALEFVDTRNKISQASNLEKHEKLLQFKSWENVIESEQLFSPNDVELKDRAVGRGENEKILKEFQENKASVRDEAIGDEKRDKLLRQNFERENVEHTMRVVLEQQDTMNRQNIVLEEVKKGQKGSKRNLEGVSEEDIGQMEKEDYEVGVVSEREKMAWRPNDNKWLKNFQNREECKTGIKDSFQQVDIEYMPNDGGKEREAVTVVNDPHKRPDHIGMSTGRDEIEKLNQQNVNPTIGTQACTDDLRKSTGACKVDYIKNHLATELGFVPSEGIEISPKFLVLDESGQRKVTICERSSESGGTENLQWDENSCSSSTGQAEAEHKIPAGMEDTKNAVSLDELTRQAGSEPKSGGMQAEAINIASENVFLSEKSTSIVEEDNNFVRSVHKIEDMTKSFPPDLSDEIASKTDIASEQVPMGRKKSIPRMDSDPEHQEKEWIHGTDDKEKSFNLVEGKEDKVSIPGVRVSAEEGSEAETTQHTTSERTQKSGEVSHEINVNQATEKRGKSVNQSHASNGKETERVRSETELENDILRKLEEEREREREREKDRMPVDRIVLETRDRVAAHERLATEARQRTLAEARERLEKACAEARENSLAGKATMEARVRAERAAVERATAEARERAADKAVGERTSFGVRERIERSVSDKFSASSRNNDLRQKTSSYVQPNLQSQSFGSTIASRHTSYSAYDERNEGVDGESPQRCKARLERHQRTAERAAKALAEKNMRDLLAQREQTERNRLAETLDADVRRWSSGKEGNLRALLSTLQYILGTDSGWQPIPLTEVITAAAVKKAYRKATLCVHPDKLQQRGASIQQKYICEKVFDLLKEAWNKFNSEER